DRRDRSRPRPLRRAAASLRRGAAVGGPDPRPGRQAPTHRVAGRRAEPDPAAFRLPIPHQVPDPKASSLRPGNAAAEAERRRALGSLSPARLIGLSLHRSTQPYGATLIATPTPARPTQSRWSCQRSAHFTLRSMYNVVRAP